MQKIELEGDAYVTYQWVLSNSHSKYFDISYYPGKTVAGMWGAMPARVRFYVCEGMICTLKIIQGITCSDGFTEQEYKDAFFYGMCAYVYSQKGGDKHYYGNKLSRAYMSTQIEDEYSGRTKKFLIANNFDPQGHYEVGTDNEDPETKRHILIRNDEEEFNEMIEKELHQWRKKLSD